MSSLMSLEADSRGILDAASHGHERGILKFNFQKENEVFENIEVFEEKELGIPPSQKAEVQ